MKVKLQGILVAAVLVICGALVGGPAHAGAPPEPFLNGFEAAGDVDAGNNMCCVTRVASGTAGVTSADGAWHAIAPAGSFTRYGGYSSIFPQGGYSTSIDIYLDMAQSPISQDIRFDWSSAINNSAGGHLRDFIFSVGTNGTGGFVMSASNNSPGWPANPGRDPLTITTTGWYSFQHTFYDNGAGVLAVDMKVLDSDGNVLKTWTLSNPTDNIGTTVGGNRYGWLVVSGFAGLAIDNIIRTGESPLQVRKTAVRDDLVALLPTGDADADHRVSKAVSSLDKSLAAALWADPDTLVAKKGKKVFDEEAKAVSELGKVLAVDLTGYITELVDIDLELALGAIEAAGTAYDDANCVVTMTSSCEKAAQALAKADEAMTKAATALADGDAHKAILEYKKAWEQADKALKELS